MKRWRPCWGPTLRACRDDLKDVWRREYDEAGSWPAFCLHHLQRPSTMNVNDGRTGRASSCWRCTTAFAKASCRGRSRVEDLKEPWARAAVEVGGRRRRDGLLGGLRKVYAGAAASCSISCRRACRAKPQALRDIYLASADGGGRSGPFRTYDEKKFPKAVRLEKDRKVLLAFYDFPRHWGHFDPPLRRSDSAERRVAAAGRHRRWSSCSAERHWRRLNGSEVIVHVFGKEFKDGLMVQENAA